MSSWNVEVPLAVIERASVHDMIYPACPRCSSSLSKALQQLPLDRIGVVCASCRTSIAPEAVAYKFRLKLQLIIDTSIQDAMLFNEVAETFMGVPATRLRKLVNQYPTLPTLLEELLLGLPVHFTYQPAENRRTSEEKTYQRDLRVLSIRPAATALLPKPPVSLALAQLANESKAITR